MVLLKRKNRGEGRELVGLVIAYLMSKISFLNQLPAICDLPMLANI